MKLQSSWILVLSLVFITACKQNYVPKPKGYYRITLPTSVTYQSIKQQYPYIFEISDCAKIKELQSEEKSEWANIVYPKYKATIHLSYEKVDENLPDLINEAHKLAFKHTVKADAIEQKIFYYPENSTAGVIYQLKGNTASPYQFFATDSTNNFLRGALYFETRPNRDSLMPVIDFIEEDVYHLIETLKWN